MSDSADVHTVIEFFQHGLVDCGGRFPDSLLELCYISCGKGGTYTTSLMCPHKKEITRSDIWRSWRPFHETSAPFCSTSDLSLGQFCVEVFTNITMWSPILLEDERIRIRLHLRHQTLLQHVQAGISSNSGFGQEDWPVEFST
jgi:hypothetical protein